jgi:DNA polymerase sigma
MLKIKKPMLTQQHAVSMIDTHKNKTNLRILLFLFFELWLENTPTTTFTYMHA